MKNDSNKILNSTLKYAKKLAKDFYFKNWVKNQPECLAFRKEPIRISRVGWEHIIHDESKTKMDILGRIFILQRAKKLLETANQFQDYTKRDNIEYWIFNAIVDRVKIRVIVRSINGEEKHLLSVIRKGSVK